MARLLATFVTLMLIAVAFAGCHASGSLGN
jgi:hypothetical protein